MSAFSSTNKLFSITLLCVIFCFGWSSQAKVKVQIPAAAVKQLREVAKKCEAETGAPASLLKSIIEWPYPTDEKSLNFLDCVCFTVGYTDETGHIIAENLGALPVAEGTQDQHLEIIKECNKITKGNKMDTLMAVGDCLDNACQYIVVT